MSGKMAFLMGQSKKLKYLLTIIGVWVIAKYLRRQREKQKMLQELRAFAKGSAAGSSSKVDKSTSSTASRDKKKKKKRKKKDNSISEVWEILKPQLPWGRMSKVAKKYAANTGALVSAGRREIFLMFFLCLGRTWLMNKYSLTVGNLDSTMMTRHQPTFWSWWRYALVLATVTSVHRTVYKYVENNLATIWQNKLVKIIHSLYFKNIAYYKVCQSAAIGADNAIPDPDDRIVADVKEVTQQMAFTLCQSLYTSTAGVYFAWKLGRLYGVRYTLAPYLYIIGMFTLCSTVAPMKWSKYTLPLQDTRSALRAQIARVIGNQEAVVAQKGSNAEASLLRQHLGAAWKAVARFSSAVAFPNFCNDLAFTWWLRTFIGWFVIGPHIKGGAAGKAPDTLEAIAKLRGDIGHQFVLFVQSMIAAGLTAKMLSQLSKIAGSARRVMDLIKWLEGYHEHEAAHRAEAAAAIVSTNSTLAARRPVDAVSNGSPDQTRYIAFNNVTITTPTGRDLVRGLTFRVNHGESLLLTGHNGAGKSSIFRCLGGLWDIDPANGGRIEKPGSAGASDGGLHTDVFYLPQKPYSVLGTIFDQLTYPNQVNVRGGGAGGETMSEAQLRGYLREVGLEDVVDRPGVLTTEVNWDQQLSSGEKQRFAIARLMYHRPAFAILDECTSAISSAMERKLYDLCRRFRISCITISHRPALREFHDIQLTILGDETCGYELDRLPATSSNRGGFGAEESKEEQPISDGTASATDSLLSASQLREKYALDNAHSKTHTQSKQQLVSKSPKAKTPFVVSLHNMWTMFRLGISREISFGAGRRVRYADAKVVAILAGIAASIVAQATILIYGTGTFAKMMRAVFAQDRPHFHRLLLQGTGFAFVAAFLEQTTEFSKRQLVLALRRNLSNSFVSRLMEDDNFYFLHNRPLSAESQSSKDSRYTIAQGELAVLLSEDVEVFAKAMGDIFSTLFKPVIQIGAFSAVLYRLVGPVVAGIFLSYLGGGLVLIRTFIPNFEKFTKREASLEARFRYVHSRVKEHAESIAFYAGDDLEGRLVEREFENLMTAVDERHHSSFRFNLVNQAVVREAPMLVQWLMRNYYGLNYGSDEALVADSGATLNTNQLFIFEATQQMFKGLADLLSFVEKFSSIFGQVNRLHSLHNALDDLGHATKNRLVADSQAEAGASADVNSIVVHHADIVTPTRGILAEDVSVSITPSSPLLVTGPNASGKSAFYRIIAGLWQIGNRPGDKNGNGRGSVVAPVDHDGRPGIFLVPTKPYMPFGSLAFQLTYPKVANTADATLLETLQVHLDSVGVGYLSNLHGWDGKKQWEAVLSLGEQQRIGMARLFFHRPLYAVLDECTSAVSVDAEIGLYTTANKLGITCITISQRLALPQFHSQELRLGPQVDDGEPVEASGNLWSLRPVEQAV